MSGNEKHAYKMDKPIALKPASAGANVSELDFAAPPSTPVDLDAADTSGSSEPADALQMRLSGLESTIAQLRRTVRLLQDGSAAGQQALAAQDIALEGVNAKLEQLSRQLDERYQSLRRQSEDMARASYRVEAACQRLEAQLKEARDRPRRKSGTGGRPGLWVPVLALVAFIATFAYVRADFTTDQVSRMYGDASSFVQHQFGRLFSSADGAVCTDC